MPYLNTRTGEYPRFAGDVALTPTDAWVFVEEVPPPHVTDKQTVAEGAPEKNPSGVYHQTWVVTSYTDEEWEQRRLDLARSRLTVLGITVADLKKLLAEGE